MTTTHNASDELLLAYAAGQLSPAPALVVATHLAMSDDASQRFETFESLGGAILEEQPMAELAPDLFERMLARLDETGEDVRDEPHAEPDHGPLRLGVDLPGPLASRKIGRWRFIAPGMRYARVEVPEDPSFNVVLLRVGAGKALPMHGHSGTELTLILKGAYRDSSGRYGPGDLDEEGEETAHQPIVETDAECICLSAINGTMLPHGWLARMLQPLIGF
jgi:putative transcriptional regulator